MRFTAYLLSATAATILAATPFAAHADTVSTFSLTDATFSSGATASGTVAIDITTGVATDSDITYMLGSSTHLFTGQPGDQQDVPENGDPIFFEMISSGNSLSIALPGASFIGYSGSHVCSLSNESGCGDTVGAFNGTDIFETGSLIFDSSVTTGQTPEPSSLALFGTGLLGVLGAVRRKFSA
jgi:hypothetical protein